MIAQQFIGSFKLVSQDNFEEYLKAVGKPLSPRFLKNLLI